MQQALCRVNICECFWEGEEEKDRKIDERGTCSTSSAVSIGGVAAATEVSELHPATCREERVLS